MSKEKLSRHSKSFVFQKESGVEIAAAAAAADPWRGLGADDGAAVPVSGVCASAASDLGTERLFCC